VSVLLSRQERAAQSYHSPKSGSNRAQGCAIAERFALKEVVGIG